MEYKWLVGLLTLGVLLGCDGGGDGPGPDALPPPETVAGETIGDLVSDLTAVSTPGNSLAAWVLWTTDTPASTALDLDCGPEWTHHLEIAGLRTQHEVFIMGLWDGAQCNATVSSEAADGTMGGGTVHFSAGPLPTLLPPLELTVNDPARVMPGWTMFNLNELSGEAPLLIALVDEQGRYRWYHQRAGGSPSAATAVYLMDEGLLVGSSSSGGSGWPALIDWEGSVLWERKFAMHHDFHPLDADRWIWLGKADACPNDIPSSGTLNFYDRDLDQTVWSWSFCEHYMPNPVVEDWDHLNAVIPVPGEETLLISAKEQHAMFKIDPGTGQVIWRLGQDGDFTRTDGEMPALANQHAPEFVDEDEILVFDNGVDGWREESGAVQVRFDETAMTYEVVWSWYPDPPIYCWQWGDADRLANGNTLVTFGRHSKSDDSHIIEVTPDGDRVWQLVTPVNWGWYRSHRIPALAPGIVKD